MSIVSGSLPAAEDAVQEALVRAWERIERGERIETLPGWVMTVAMNLVKSGLRRRIRERRALARLEEPESLAAMERRLFAADEVIDLRRNLQRLSPRERQVTVLRYWLDLDVREVAGLLGVEQGTVKTLLFRARRKLGASLALREERPR